MCTGSQGKGAVTSQETEPDLPVSILGSPVEAWSAMACCRKKVAGDSSPGRGMLAYILLEFAFSPTIKPVDLMSGLPQAKQLIEREHSPTCQQTVGLKIY